MKKEYHGKAIYQPSGKAAEYGECPYGPNHSACVPVFSSESILI